MTGTAEKVYSQIITLARKRRRPTDELLTLYGLERFLARLGMTDYADDFCLKGGVLLSAHALRRPTRDIDMQALDFQLDVDHLTEVVTTVVAVDAEDGIAFSQDDPKIEQIRDDDEYTGLRATLPAKIHRGEIVIKLDVSTGDPIWPAPERVELPSLLGGTIAVQGHPLTTVIAEKTVTMLQRGTTSTRWRDLLDVGALSTTYPFDAGQLSEAVHRVASHREAEVRALRPLLAGYGDYVQANGVTAQAKWAKWRKNQRVEDLCHADIDDQVAQVLAFADPIFTGEARDGHSWDPDAARWS
ncbi:nucleotidyl transferase AbiEii/AbiGii toxin family protein [Sinomonas soli]